MIQNFTLSVTTTAQSLAQLGVSGLFTKIRFGPSGSVQIGGSSLNITSNQGIVVPASLPALELEFDPDDDPGNNLYLAAPSNTSITIFVW